MPANDGSSAPLVPARGLSRPRVSRDLVSALAHDGGMSEVWTHGTWTVIAGRESDFVRLWEQLGDWTVNAFQVHEGRS